MFGLFKNRDKVGKQTQSADVHNPIMRAAAEGQMNALGARQDFQHRDCNASQNTDMLGFYQSMAAHNAEEVRRLSKALAIHEARYAKQMAGLKKATAAAAEKRRKV